MATSHSHSETSLVDRMRQERNFLMVCLPIRKTRHALNIWMAKEFFGITRL